MFRLPCLLLGAAVPTAVSVEKFYIGLDDNYPPYATRDENGTHTGFGYDIAMGVNAVCPELDIEVVYTEWVNCWDGTGAEPVLGKLLDNGTLHACATYTHTKGIRNEYADFSYGILNVNKAAGLLTMLNKDGTPVVNGNSDLDGVTVVDVAGWAPTADTIAFVNNFCTGELYSSKYTMKSAQANDVRNANDEAMHMLRHGEADAMFVYADQAHNYQCEAGTESEKAWNCTLWKGFGTEYAYVQTGQFGYVFNGTTLALAKKGSGAVEKLNPCLDRYMLTQDYHDVCVKWHKEEECYPNEFFTAADKEHQYEFNKETSEHKGDCSNGYCPCPDDDGDYKDDKGGDDKGGDDKGGDDKEPEKNLTDVAFTPAAKGAVAALMLLRLLN
jgi:ABC-type amino acid transport substrate-binding protein